MKINGGSVTVILRRSRRWWTVVAKVAAWPHLWSMREALGQFSVRPTFQLGFLCASQDVARLLRWCVVVVEPSVKAWKRARCHNTALADGSQISEFDYTGICIISAVV